MEYSTTQNKAYTLVLFIDNTEDNGDKSKKIDIVPTSWLFRDGKDKVYCPFIEDDPDPEEIQLLHQLIKNQMPPKNTWETFEVDIRGDAHTYGEALKKIDKLQLHPYVFTTDNEKHVKERKEEIKNKVRRRGPSQKSNVMELLCESAAALDKLLQAHKTLSILQEKISDQKNPKRADRQETTKKKGETKNSGTRPKSSKPQKSSAQQPDLSDACSYNNLSLENNPGETLEQMTFSREDDLSKNIEIPQQSLESQHSSGMDELLLHLNDLFSKLRYQIGTVQHEIVNLKQEVTFWKKIILSSSHGTRQRIESPSINIPIPFANMEDFLIFDEKLKNEKNLRHYVVSQISTFINIQDKLSRSIKLVIGKYFTRDVVMQFTVVRKTKNKPVFKDTKFCSCLQQAVEAEYNKCADAGSFKVQSFYDTIGHVFNNARDWDGFRSKRNNASNKPKE